MADPLATARDSERRRARVTLFLIYACLALDVVAIVSDLLQMHLLDRVAKGGKLSDSEASANDVRQGAIAILQTGAFLFSGVAWLSWLHRAYASLRLVGTGKSKFTPGWAVGYWFIPVINLLRPYQIVRDLWIRSDRLNADVSVEDAPSPSLVGSWWLVYIASGVAAWVVRAGDGSGRTVDRLMNNTLWSVVLNVAAVASALLAAAVVRGIHLRQQRFDTATATAALD